MFITTGCQRFGNLIGLEKFPTRAFLQPFLGHLLRGNNAHNILQDRLLPKYRHVHPGTLPLTIIISLCIYLHSSSFNSPVIPTKIIIIITLVTNLHHLGLGNILINIFNLMLTFLLSNVTLRRYVFNTPCRSLQSYPRWSGCHTKISCCFHDVESALLPVCRSWSHFSTLKPFESAKQGVVHSPHYLSSCKQIWFT